jgi:Tfp pilus assembly protein PilX
MGEHPIQSASIRGTAKAFSLPARALYRAVAAGELRAYCASGRRNVVLWDDVRAWLRTRPAPSRIKHAGGDHAAV